MKLFIEFILKKNELDILRLNKYYIRNYRESITNLFEVTHFVDKLLKKECSE